MTKQVVYKSFGKHAGQASKLKRLLWAVEAGLTYVMFWLSRRFTPDRASAIGRRLLRILGPHLEKTRRLRRNLDIAFPEKSRTQMDAIIRDTWGEIGAVLAEQPHLQTICEHDAENRIEIIHKSETRVFREPGRPAVFVSAHLANWEVALGALGLHGTPFLGIYTPLQNPWLDRMLYEQRRAVGARLISRDKAAKEMVRSLKKGISVGLFVDLRVDSGEPVMFFGREMLTSITPAQLALRFDCELIPVQVQRLEGARFRVIYHEPVQPDDATADTQQQILQMTRKVNTLFESWIRERPGEWFCSTRRWPKERPLSAG